MRPAHLDDDQPLRRRYRSSQEAATPRPLTEIAGLDDEAKAVLEMSGVTTLQQLASLNRRQLNRLVGDTEVLLRIRDTYRQAAKDLLS